MKNLDTDIIRKSLPKFYSIIRHIFSIQTFTFFHHRTDHISLSSHMDLFFNKRICFWAIRSTHHAVLNRKSLCWKLVNNGDIQIPVQDDRQGPRDRSSAHNKYMRWISSGSQCLSLTYAKPVLLICDNQSKIFIFYLLLDQRMSPDDNICLTFCNLLIDFPFLFCRTGPRQKYRMAGSNILFFH